MTGNASEGARVFVPSDMLRQFADVLQEFPWLAAALGGDVLTVRAVLDANVLLQDVRLAARARNAAMRPAIEELIDCGVLCVIAPDSVRLEVESHLLEIASSNEEMYARVVEVWARYSGKVEWVAEERYARCMDAFPLLAARDRTDLPLAAVALECGADMIVSDDRDLVDSSEILTVTRPLTLVLREYARAKATGVAATTIPAIAIVVPLFLFAALLDAVPPGLRLIAGVAVVAGTLTAIALVPDESRREFATTLVALLRWSSEALPANESAAKHEAEVRRRLPTLGPFAQVRATTADDAAAQSGSEIELPVPVQAKSAARRAARRSTRSTSRGNPAGRRGPTGNP